MSAKGFKAGDKVLVRRIGNQDWINEIGEDSVGPGRNRWRPFNITNAKNGWVRNISALHFGSSLVSLTASTKWFTVQDCVSREPVSIRAGARRFTFMLSGQLAFVQSCFSQKGRHSFVMGNPGSCGNVFLDCEAVNPYSTSEPHSQWVNGALYDNVNPPLSARYWKDISIGWAGANIVFRNCKGDYLIQSPPTAKN